MPVATIVTAPEPPSTALIPLSAPDTDTAVIMMPAPLASLVALMPSPFRPVTVPLTLMEIAPPPELLAAIALIAPVIDWPVADWVKLMPPAPPVCVRTNAVPPVSTGVSEFSVTDSALAPLALRDWVAPIWLVPLQVNAPLPVGSQSLVK